MSVFLNTPQLEIGNVSTKGYSIEIRNNTNRRLVGRLFFGHGGIAWCRGYATTPAEGVRLSWEELIQKLETE